MQIRKLLKKVKPAKVLSENGHYKEVSEFYVIVHLMIVRFIHVFKSVYLEATLITANRTRLSSRSFQFTFSTPAELLNILRMLFDGNITRSSANISSPLLKILLKLGLVGQTSSAWGISSQQMLNSSIASLIFCSSILASFVLSDFPKSQSRWLCLSWFTSALETTSSVSLLDIGFLLTLLNCWKSSILARGYFSVGNGRMLTFSSGLSILPQNPPPPPWCSPPHPQQK